jgi:hypothetical protein
VAKAHNLIGNGLEYMLVFRHEDSKPQSATKERKKKKVILCASFFFLCLCGKKYPFQLYLIIIYDAHS